MAEFQEKVEQPISWKKILFISMIGGGVLMLFFPNWTNADTLWLWIQDYFVKVIYWVVLWKANEWTVLLLNNYISWLEKPVLRFIISTVATIVITILAITLLQIFFAWLFYGVTPVQVLKNVTPNSFIYTILITGAISLLVHGRAFLLGWRQTAIEVEKLKQAKSQY